MLLDGADDFELAAHVAIDVEPVHCAPSKTIGQEVDKDILPFKMCHQQEQAFPSTPRQGERIIFGQCDDTLEPLLSFRGIGYHLHPHSLDGELTLFQQLNELWNIVRLHLRLDWWAS